MRAVRTAAFRACGAVTLMSTCVTSVSIVPRPDSCSVREVHRMCTAAVGF